MHEINTAATSSSPCTSQGNNEQFRNRIKQSCTVFPCTPSIFALSFWSYTRHFETKLIVMTSLHAYILTKKFTSTIY